MDRIILHCDMNNFYASVACKQHPEYAGKPVAVCGAQEDRHGVVLAKNMQAKACGVQTGEPTVKALQKCPDLIVVMPDFPEYARYSHLAREIYERYTDQVEPFGMDECWLDVTGSTRLFGSGEEMADRIRREVREELGLTISVGVSFNKVFAKLGSDMKKPDATTCLPRESMQEVIWPLPVEDLLGVGRSTKERLHQIGIRTIGGLACTPEKTLRAALGESGSTLWRYANGLEQEAVMHKDYVADIKTVGRGITCPADLQNNGECRLVLLALAQPIGQELRRRDRMATGVAVEIKDNALRTTSYQCRLTMPTQDSLMLAKVAFAMLCRRYPWHLPVRALTVRAIDLMPAASPTQLDLFSGAATKRRGAVEDSCDRIRDRYGDHAINPASLLGQTKMPDDIQHSNAIPAFVFVPYEANI
jgi:DNA polymerase-4